MISRLCPHKVTDIFFYSPPSRNLKSTNIYRMFDCKKRAYIGEMDTSARLDFYISYLNIKSEYRRQGYGTRFLNFARLLSEKAGSGGSLRVLASVTNDTANPPHVFYRKYGFTAYDERTLNKIDKSIEENKQLDYKKIPPIYMYYKSKQS